MRRCDARSRAPLPRHLKLILLLAVLPTRVVAGVAPLTIQAVPLTAPVVVDGQLDEAAWREPPAAELAFEVTPGENLQPPARTEMWVAFDREAVYFAFRAHDPRPGDIRARLTDRDAAFEDDFVGVVLDPFAEGQRAFEFFSNPLGVQMDLIVDDVAGNEDATWDTRWRAAGRLTPQGYEVEMAIPFSSLRFPRGDGAMTWGFDAARIRPRGSRAQYALSPRQRGRNCSLCQSSRLAGVVGPPPGLDFELAPTLTGERTDRRPPGRSFDWSAESESAEPGLTARWGITPDWTFVGTLNPDFSQVEADAAQLEVNQQFALFYPEKRPFFLESADLFDSQLDVLHTRTVTDPAWGAKLVGRQGGHAFGLVAARDERTNLLVPGREASHHETLPGASSAAFGRWRHDLGRGSSLGVIASGRVGEQDYRNAVAGFDALFRLGDALTLRLEGFGSSTRYPTLQAEEWGPRAGDFSGHAARAGVDYSKRDWFAESEVTTLSDGFRADLGFIPQVGVVQGVVRGGRRWYGDGGRWFDKMTLGATYYRTEDHDGFALRDEKQLWVMIDGPWQSHLFFEIDRGGRGYQGRGFGADALRFEVEAQPRHWLRLELEGMTGDGIDYAAARPGDLVQLGAEVGLALGRHLDLELAGEGERLEVAEGRLYTATVARLRATYQLNLRTFVRWVSQLVSVERRPDLPAAAVFARSRDWGNQLLFSYKLDPQTVLFLGYSDGWVEDGRLDLARTSRTVFLKLGYAWQI